VHCRISSASAANLAVALPDHPGHPGWVPTCKAGDSLSTHVLAFALEDTQRQIAKRFNALIRELTEVNEQLCHLLLKAC